jgi:hypothetical protein
VQVDWDQIDRVESQRFFQFHTKAGERLLGRILEMSHEPAGDEIVILEGTSRRTFAHDEIVMVSQTVRGVDSSNRGRILSCQGQQSKAVLSRCQPQLRNDRVSCFGNSEFDFQHSTGNDQHQPPQPQTRFCQKPLRAVGSGGYR